MSYAANGAKLTEAQFNALTSTPPTPPAMRVMTADVFQAISYPNAKFEGGQRLLFHAGQVVAQATIDSLFVDATVDTVAPATGPAAGGTDLTITGTNFGGVSGVTVGGVAATQVRVLSETKITCRTGAHAAGAVPVVVQDDSGAQTKANGYTFV